MKYFSPLMNWRKNFLSSSSSSVFFLCVYASILIITQPMSVFVSALRPTVLVTGSTDGIGVTTAKNMAAKGYNVLIHGRDERRIERATAAVKKFVEQHSNENPQIVPLPAQDISTIDGCERLVESVQSACLERGLDLYVLMNNAGVYSEKLVLTEGSSFELTFAVNVLATFVITSYLLPTLLKQPKSRIVIASSISQCRDIRDWDDLPFYARQTYSAHKAYSESKLLDAMLSMEFAKRLQDLGFATDKITCNCLDPGTVNTKMLLAGWGPCGIDVEDALDETWLCTSDEVENVTGQYFTWRSSRRASSAAYDQNQRDRMWKLLSDIAPEAAAMWKAKHLSESSK